MIDRISLSGKRALVGGSTQGIGKAIAFEFAKLGAEVVLAARNEEKLTHVLPKLPSDSAMHSYVVADYSDPQSLENAIHSVDDPVHIIVNNTGGPPGGKAVDASPDDYMGAFKQHLICNQILLQKFVPAMKKEGYGRVINILSTSVKQPIPNLGVSNTIRGAVAQWSKTLANELGGYGITVNNVLPGMTKTTRLSSIITNRSRQTGKSEKHVSDELLKTIPAKRFAEAEEIAYAAAFLASPAGSYVNGINLPVDGGRIGGL